MYNFVNNIKIIFLNTALQRLCLSNVMIIIKHLWTGIVSGYVFVISGEQRCVFIPRHWPWGYFWHLPHAGVLYVRDPLKLDREVQDTFTVIVSRPMVIAYWPFKKGIIISSNEGMLLFKKHYFFYSKSSLLVLVLFECFILFG